MNKFIYGGILVAGVVGTLVILQSRSDAQSELVMRHSATEAMYAEFDDLGESMRAVSDTDIQEHFFALGFGYRIARSLLLDRDFPMTTVAYGPHELAALPHYPNTAAFAEAYLGAVRAEWRPGFDYPYIAIRTPIQYPFGTEMTLQSIKSADNQDVPVAAEEDPSATGLQAFKTDFPGEIRVKSTFDVVPDKPISALIEFSVDVPTEVTVLSFPNVKTGDRQIYGDYTITITDVTPNYAEATISRTDGRGIEGSPIRVDIGAKDSAGYPIKRGALAAGSVTDIEALRKGIEEVITMAESDLGRARDLARALVDDQKQRIARASFQGDLDQLDIYVIDMRDKQTISRNIAVPVVDFQAAEEDEIRALPTDRDLIDADLLMLIDGTNDVFSARELRRDLKTWQNNTKLYFALPPRVSDLFLSSFDRLKRHGNLEFGRGNRDIDHEDPFLYDVQPMRIDFDADAFPEQPRQISGEIAFRVIDGISRETYPVDALPTGISATDNRLVLTGDIYRAFAGRDVDGGFPRYDGRTVDSSLKVVALNPDGKPLRLFQAVRGRGDAGEQVSLYFHGHPASVLILRRGEVSEVVVPIDQDLDPRLYKLEVY